MIIKNPEKKKSAVYNHFYASSHLLGPEKVIILDKEAEWLGGIREAIWERVKQLVINKKRGEFHLK